MKIVKCRKCHAEFQMPDNFSGTILCEDCDPFMNNGAISPKYTSVTSDREELSPLLRLSLMQANNNALREEIAGLNLHRQKQQKIIDALKAQNPDVPCPACGGSGNSDEHDRCFPPNYYVCETCNHTGKVPLTKALEYRIRELEEKLTEVMR